MSRVLTVFLAVVAIVAAQYCETCDNRLASLAATVSVCGADALHTYRALDFNLIAIGDGEGLAGNIFSDTSGDVEGRVLAAGDLTLVGGYSIGDKIVNYPPPAAPWEQRAFSAVVGGNVNWQEGQLNPVRDDSDHRIETGVYYGTENVAPYLPFEQCTTGPLDVSALRLALQTLSTEWADAATNAQATFDNNTGLISLWGSMSSCNYIIEISAADWNDHRGFIPMNWNVAANVVIDIDCTGEEVVFFQEGEFPGLAENIVYNFGPTCAGVTIEANSVHGSILAPWSTLVQTDGRIWGNVFVGEVAQFLQINVIDCPPNPESCDCCNLCV